MVGGASGNGGGINSDASGVQVEEMVSDAAASSQREVTKPKPGWTPVRLVYQWPSCQMFSVGLRVC